MIQCRLCQMLVLQVRLVRVERNVQWGIQPAVLEVLADQEVATRPSKEREAETEGPLLQRY